jgi:hypothetical protein
MSDRVERVARAIFAAFYGEGVYQPVQWVMDAASAALKAADGPNSTEVREQMLRENYGPEYRIYERYGSNRPRAQWDVT